MKRMIVAAKSLVHYRVYELDDFGEEIDCIKSYSSKDAAIKYAKQYSANNDVDTHVVACPIDEDNQEVREYFEYELQIEPYEVIYESKGDTLPAKKESSKRAKQLAKNHWSKITDTLSNYLSKYGLSVEYITGYDPEIPNYSGYYEHAEYRISGGTSGLVMDDMVRLYGRKYKDDGRSIMIVNPSTGKIPKKCLDYIATIFTPSLYRKLESNLISTFRDKGDNIEVRPSAPYNFGFIIMNGYSYICEISGDNIDYNTLQIINKAEL